MRRTILEPLRWVEDPARVMVIENGGPPKAYFQVVTNLRLRRMCVGRPVEELPRILTILSPTHHLVSALALDALFKVEPPPLAVNMRQALLETLFLGRHLRKLYFFLSSHSDPFEDFTLSHRNTGKSSASRDLIDHIMRHVALTQEASRILGGRADHPISVVPGGVSRFLKQQYYDRLSEIGQSCSTFTIALACLLAKERIEDHPWDVELQSVLAMSMSEDHSEIEIRDSSGQTVDKFPVEQIFDKIGFHEEPWTYKPFAFLKEKGWVPLDSDNVSGVYFVGPLARLISKTELELPFAKEDAKVLLDEFARSPRFTVANAYRSLILEVCQSAERISDLYRQENLTGPIIRNIPTEIGGEGFAAIESPEGLIAHRYRIDKRGVVREIEIIDSATQNNALKCLIVKNIVDRSADWNKNTNLTKATIEKALLPF